MVGFCFYRLFDTCDFPQCHWRTLNGYFGVKSIKPTRSHRYKYKMSDKKMICASHSLRQINEEKFLEQKNKNETARFNIICESISWTSKTIISAVFFFLQ